ncbi:hypothetical protein DFS33DRAFT_1393888 [Desarmillaria ectypa]|nr:hypothetical protein DFS33DRAFT_1393888 [Desarmillaria ectypa]
MIEHANLADSQLEGREDRSRSRTAYIQAAATSTTQYDLTVSWIHPQNSPRLVLSPSQVEVSGLLRHGEGSPYPEVRSHLNGFWQCGSHREKFLAKAVIGPLDEVLGVMLKDDSLRGQVGAVWMTKDWASKEFQEERAVRRVAKAEGTAFKVWDGEEMLIHDGDLPRSRLPDIFTSFRKSVEHIRDHSFQPQESSAASNPCPATTCVAQVLPPCHRPLVLCRGHPEKDLFPPVCNSTRRIPCSYKNAHLPSSGAVSRYKGPREGLLGMHFSTKLSAYLALGYITTRQVNGYLVQFDEVKGRIKAQLYSALNYGDTTCG